jgi:hypothetical protein
LRKRTLVFLLSISAARLLSIADDAANRPRHHIRAGHVAGGF